MLQLILSIPDVQFAQIVWWENASTFGSFTRQRRCGVDVGAQWRYSNQVNGARINKHFKCCSGWWFGTFLYIFILPIDIFQDGHIAPPTSASSHALSGEFQNSTNSRHIKYVTLFPLMCCVQVSPWRLEATNQRQCQKSLP